MTERQNARAERAAKAISASGYNNGLKLESAMSDLLKDLQHLADREDINIEFAMAVAREYYREECKEEASSAPKTNRSATTKRRVLRARAMRRNRRNKNILMNKEIKVTDLNQRRATRAANALIAAYYKNSGLEWQSAVGDMLADVRHLADDRGFDFDIAVEMSAKNFQTEQREDSLTPAAHEAETVDGEIDVEYEEVVKEEAIDWRTTS